MSTELETVQPVQAMPVAITEQPQSLTTLSLGQLWKLGKMLVGTGFLPQELRTAEQALAVMVKGQELRVPPMYALSNIRIVKGLPTCSSELMLALIRRDYGPRAIRVAVTNAEYCLVEWRQEGWDGIQSYAFSMDDARTAGLAGQPTWQKYPAALLRARCISAVARMAFPECIAGMYTPDELMPDVAVRGDGEQVLTLERDHLPSDDADIVQSAQEDYQTAAPDPAPVVQTPYRPEDERHAPQADDEPPSAHTDATLAADLDAAFTAQAGAVTIRFPNTPQGQRDFIAACEGRLGLDAKGRQEALGGSVAGYIKAREWKAAANQLDLVFDVLKAKVDDNVAVPGRIEAQAAAAAE